MVALASSSVVCVPRWATPRRLERRTLGPQVAAIMRKLGTPPMPWQELALDVALELLPDGSLAYRQVIITVERQQGKTTLMLGVEVQRALLWARPRQRIYYSAQTGQDGRQKLIDDQAPILESSPLMAGVLQIR